MSRSYDPGALLIGVIGRPHGLRGETSLRPYGGRSDLASLATLLLEQQGQRVEWRVRSLRRTREGWLVRLDGIESRQAAEALTNAPVWVARQALPPLGPGEFYVEDVVGCRVETEQGKALGVVEGVFWNGAQDVMTVGAGGAGFDKADSVLIPLVPAFVRTVEPAMGRVVVAWEGDEADL